MLWAVLLGDLFTKRYGNDATNVPYTNHFKELTGVLLC